MESFNLAQSTAASYLGRPVRSGAPPRSLRPFLVCCSQGFSGAQSKKGFGNVEKEDKKGKKIAKELGQKGKVPPKAVAIKEGSREMKKLIDSVEKESKDDQYKKLNIDPAVAAKGKVDFVRVESWGDEGGAEPDLENLKMKTFSSGFDASDYSAPFFEQLVRRIQLLESKGEISVAQAQPLPPFEKWAFGVQRYVQFLVEQRAVHEALEGVIAAINEKPSSEEANGAWQAIGLFSTTLGLHRSEAIALDLTRLSEQVGGSLPDATTQTVAYVKYIQRLGTLGAGDTSESKESCLRLLAHVFSVHIAHLTTGMRVGSKALEDLVALRSAKAVSFYRDYPQEASDPLKVFISACNKAGKCISAEADLEQVMQELPKAIQKTSLLVSTLAVVEQQQQQEPAAL